MRIAIVGAGALGLYYGAMLQRAGQEVHFLLRRDLFLGKSLPRKSGGVDEEKHNQFIH